MISQNPAHVELFFSFKFLYQIPLHIIIWDPLLQITNYHTMHIMLEPHLALLTIISGGFTIIKPEMRNYPVLE